METKQLKQHIEILKASQARLVIQPILSNISFCNGRLMSSDLDSCVMTDTEKAINPDINTTVSLDRLGKFVKAAKAPSVSFSHDKATETLTVTSGKMTTELRTSPLDEFPVPPYFPESKEDNKYTVKASDFYNWVDRLKTAFARDKANNVLEQVCFTFSTHPGQNNSVVEIVATNGSVLHKITTSRAGLLNSRFMVDGAKLADIATRLKRIKYDGLVSFCWNDEKKEATNHWSDYRHGFIGLRTDFYDFYLKRFTGQYPVYNQLIPDISQCDNWVYFTKIDLLDALKSIAPFTNDRTNIVKFAGCDVTNSVWASTELSADVPDVGKTRIKLPVNIRKGVLPAMAFNYKYLINAIEHMAGTVVVLHCSGPISPTVLRSPDDDTEFDALVMPVQVK